MKVIGVVGSRRRDTEKDFLLVRDKFYEFYQEGDIICSGLCPQGADWFAVLISLGKNWIDSPYERGSLYRKVMIDSTVSRVFNRDLEYKICPMWFPADWKRFGKAAGFKRNTDIALNSDYLIACVAEDRIGGTEDTVKKYQVFHKPHIALLV